MSVLLEFLEFINGGPQPAVNDLLHRVLVKSRKLTAAEAGVVFITRGQGRKKRLIVASVQNDLVKVPQEALKLSADPDSIAGYVAGASSPRSRRRSSAGWRRPWACCC